MVINILIILFSIIALIIIHELGHFVVSKKIGVRVDEFGIGYPPRIWGKKIGETIYSINLIPFGGFVRIFGEEGETSEIDKQRNFAFRPYWQKIAVIVAGVLAFWIISWPLFSAALFLGSPVSVGDEEMAENAEVRVLDISKDSPAELAGFKTGDIIRKVVYFDQESGLTKTTEVSRVDQFVEIINSQKSKKINLVLEDKKGEFEKEIIPRENPPKGQGALGVGLVRVFDKKYSAPEAVIGGFERVFFSTKSVIYSFGILIKSTYDKELKTKMNLQVVGPIGVGVMLNQSLNWGPGFYLNLIGFIAVYLAIFNILPIPATDGGQLLFLTIEKIYGKAFNKEKQNLINSLFFALLIVIMIIITISDVQRYIF
ncbi:MAG: M50 family metallopeptidase [bacterium]|nr:M50 family metallopeptidase [bacterium]